MVTPNFWVFIPQSLEKLFFGDYNSWNPTVSMVSGPAGCKILRVTVEKINFPKLWVFTAVQIRQLP